MWDFQRDLLNTFQETINGRPQHVVILKARQLGISWLIAAYALWKALFFENAKILMLSQGEDEAFKLLSKCRFINNSLPDFLKVIPSHDQKGELIFPSTDSEIIALPSTEKSGRSTDATIVICDEWEFHPYAEQNFAALKPTIDAGGQFIGLSTADKTKLNTFFKKKYMEARTGSSNFKAVFLPYNVRPGRDERWFAGIKADMSASQVEQEYPLTEEEALSATKTRCFFELGALDRMKDYIMPHSREEINLKFPSIKIYRLPVVGKRYLLFTDPSDGKEDPHAIVVIDAQTGEEVAESHAKYTADQCASIHDALVRYYNNAFNSYEANGRAGGIFDEKMRMMDTPNQCPALNPDGTLNTKGKKGWWTGKFLKDKVLGGLEEAVRLGQIIIHSKDCIDEFRNFIIPEGQEPTKVAGGHDDYIDAWARVWHLRRYAPVPSGVVKSYKAIER